MRMASLLMLSKKDKEVMAMIKVTGDLIIDIDDDVQFLISKETNAWVVILDKELPKLIQALQQVQNMKESME